MVALATKRLQVEENVFIEQIVPPVMRFELVSFTALRAYEVVHALSLV